MRRRLSLGHERISHRQLTGGYVLKSCDDLGHGQLIPMQQYSAHRKEVLVAPQRRKQQVDCGHR